MARKIHFPIDIREEYREWPYDDFFFEFHKLNACCTVDDDMEKHVQTLIKATAAVIQNNPDASIDNILDVLEYTKAPYTEDEVYEYVEKHYPLMIDSRGLPSEGIPHGTCDQS